jgi:hypothetical protein
MYVPVFTSPLTHVRYNRLPKDGPKNRHLFPFTRRSVLGPTIRNVPHSCSSSSSIPIFQYCSSSSAKPFFSNDYEGLFSALIPWGLYTYVVDVGLPLILLLKKYLRARGAIELPRGQWLRVTQMASCIEPGAPEPVLSNEWATHVRQRYQLASL